MKTGVNYTNVRYVVNEDKRTIVCLLNWEVNFNNVLSEDFVVCNNNVNKFLDEHNGEISDHSFTFESVGIAKLNVTDEFNTEFGKHLALTRAQRHAFKTAKNLYNVVLKNIMNFSKQMNDLIDNCETSANLCDFHVNDLIDTAYDK